MSGSGPSTPSWRESEAASIPNVGKAQPGDIPSGCRLAIETFLSSPKPRVLAHLKVGDLLGVALVAQHGTQVLAAVTKNGDIAGTITPGEMLRIIHCIDKFQVDYVAQVMEIAGGQCRVRVRNGVAS